MTFPQGSSLPAILHSIAGYSLLLASPLFTLELTTCVSDTGALLILRPRMLSPNMSAWFFFRPLFRAYFSVELNLINLSNIILHLTPHSLFLFFF